MWAVMQLLVVLFALIFLFDLPLLTTGTLECYEYNVNSPPTSEEFKLPEATCVSSGSFCVSSIIKRDIFQEITSSNGISYINKKNFSKEIAIKGECATADSITVDYCRKMAVEGVSCRLGNDAIDAFVWLRKKNVKDQLAEETGFAAFCCCSRTKCNSPALLLRNRPINQCYSYANVDVRQSNVEGTMTKETCSNSTYCGSALIRQTLRNGDEETKAFGTCNELRYQTICDMIGDGCMYGDKLTDMFEEINDNFKSVPWQWELMCCCRAELCNTVMAVMQMADVNTCYHYNGLLNNTSTKAQERERCPSDYCMSQIYTTKLTGNEDYFAKMNCAEKKICDDMKEQCVFTGSDYVTGIERNMSALLTEKHGKETIVELHSLCCCKGDRCNSVHAIRELYEAKFGVTTPSTVTPVEIEIAHSCLEYDFNPDDGSNASRSIGIQRCLNASEYCVSKKSLATTLAFGKTKRWLLGNCADDDQVALCKQMIANTSTYGTDSSCMFDDAAVQTELGQMFLKKEAIDERLIELKTVCCCKGDNCNTIDPLLMYSAHTATLATLNGTTTMADSSAIGMWSRSIFLLIFANLLCLLC